MSIPINKMFRVHRNNYNLLEWGARNSDNAETVTVFFKSQPGDADFSVEYRASVFGMNVRKSHRTDLPANEDLSARFCFCVGAERENKELFESKVLQPSPYGLDYISAYEEITEVIVAKRDGNVLTLRADELRS